MPDFQLYRNLAGRLVLTLPDGQVHEGVVPVRAFPISDAEFGMRSRMLAAPMKAAVNDAAVPLEAGKSTVQVQVSGSVQLR